MHDMSKLFILCQQQMQFLEYH